MSESAAEIARAAEAPPADADEAASAEARIARIARRARRIAPPAPEGPAPAEETEMSETPVAAPVANLCQDGCGRPTIRPGARFLPGHDARLKSALLRVALGRVAKGEAPPPREAQDLARQRLAELGWGAHLAVSEAMDARLAAQRANAAKGTRERNAERAAAKAPDAAAMAAWALANGWAPPTPPAVAGSDGRVPDLRLRSERSA